jgi:hypothetical protein
MRTQFARRAVPEALEVLEKEGKNAARRLAKQTPDKPLAAKVRAISHCVVKVLMGSISRTSNTKFANALAMNPTKRNKDTRKTKNEEGNASETARAAQPEA